MKSLRILGSAKRLVFAFLLALAIWTGCRTDLPAGPGAAQAGETPRASSTRHQQDSPTFRVAFAKAGITPDPARKPVWLAGFGIGRKAEGIHDPLTARAALFEQGKTRVAIVALDLVGWFLPDTEDIRRRVAKAVSIDYLVIASTHNHAGPDTLGLWGAAPFRSGVDPDYMELVKRTVTEMLVSMSGNLADARLATAETAAPVEGFVKDTRDPVVIDNTLSVLGFRGASSHEPLGTIVNWANHPEALGSTNRLLTADYPGFLCRRMEEEWGGTCVFLSGALGGMMTPDVKAEKSFPEAERIGRGIADLARGALQGRPQRVPRELRWKSQTLFLPAENRRFRLGMATGTLQRPLRWRRPRSKVPGEKLKHEPFVRTEIGWIRVGSVEMLAIPGELFPELAIGGYDGRYSFGQPTVSKDNPNPPELEKAPAEPTLRDRMQGEVKILIGLANDELGYILPEYDFRANYKNPLMEPRPPGDHYEETNSLGPQTAGLLLAAYEKLLEEAHGATR